MPVYANNIPQEKQKIKFKEIRKEIEEKTTSEKPNNTVNYYYLEHPITIDGNKYMVNRDIRKAPNYNANDKYYYHQLEFISNKDTKKESDSTLPHISGSKAGESLSSVNNLSQKKVLSNPVQF